MYDETNALTVITLAQLREFALEYDAKNGGYPEHEYEGLSFFQFVHECLTGRAPQEHPTDWEREIWPELKKDNAP